MAEASRMSPDWIRQACLANPIMKLPNGNIRTCPVRISFPWLFKPQPPMDPGSKAKFGATLLFPSTAYGVDFTPMVNDVNTIFNEEFPPNQYPRDQHGRPMGLHSPFRLQDEKAQKFEGYVPGSYFVTVTAETKRQVVDTRLNPIVDESKVYPGVWALAVINAFPFGKKPVRPKKGVSFGLNSLMIFADDTQLGGGGSDPTVDYAGITVTQNTAVDAMFGLDGRSGGTVGGATLPLQHVMPPPPPFTPGGPQPPATYAPGAADLM